jgi:pyruvate,water dikinase
MNALKRLLKKYILKEAEQDGPILSPEELRATFSSRYHSFKLLITANNKALEIMTELERALEGNQPFGMAFVRSRCTAVSVNVFRIVKELDELAPGRYSELFDRFKTIQMKINPYLERKGRLEGGPLVLTLHAIDRDMADLVGSKMANLAEIKNNVGLPVPPGFVITSAAYGRFFESNELRSEIRPRMQTSDAEKLDDLFSLSSAIQQIIIGARVPEDVEQAVLNAYREIRQGVGPTVRVSLRSSAIGEDSAGTSFAGQFRSILNLNEEHIIEAYKEIVASKYGVPAITYRRSRGIPDEDVPMCVGCMAMVDAAAGGVMYSSNPLNIRDRSVIINSVWGLPKAVVDGSVDPDVFVISPGGSPAILEKRIAQKERQYVCYPEEGVCRLDLTGDKSSDQSITDDQALELAKMAVKLETYYGAPQDIEWAAAPDGSIYILQCRPLQQLPSESSPHQAVEDHALLVHGGVTAAPGVASGKVFVVKSDVDRLRFPDGAVLVTAQALPRWAPLLSRASAVVTEVGGVAGHLANVAREFDVPALFGVPHACDNLGALDVVTVDADGRAVYQGRVDTLLEGQPTKKNLMLGSPVYEALKQAASHIVHLNLLDPDSPQFHPKKCETFHDITRFCHEKSVQEMFSFGKEHHFEERSAKQLFWHRPMQWWIINLDDGFGKDVEGKFVQLEDIVSIPMLAIWEGSTAFPWEGPPPVDSKGFMSVLLEATANPELEVAMGGSSYAARNYFMISRNFCSLQSRFGFHFSTVEALVGERSLENYASFAFKGGAADLPRRVRRALFIGSVLEEVGFRIELKEDNLFARLEGHDEKFMRGRLRVLGYLIMHTRQLDMVMAKEALIARYRTKFMNDISSLLNSPPST